MATSGQEVLSGHGAQGYVLESDRIVLEGPTPLLRENPHAQELYLGITHEPSVKGLRRYKVRRRWA